MNTTKIKTYLEIITGGELKKVRLVKRDPQTTVRAKLRELTSYYEQLAKKR